MEHSTEKAFMKLNAVIYGTDLSVFSQNAGLYAALMAKQFSAKLVVVHAFTLSQAAMEVEIDGSLLSQQRKDLHLLLSQKAAALACGTVPVIPVLRDGEPAEELRRLATTYEPAMLVLGTHGGGWLQRELIGSVAERVLRTTRWPTLTVGPSVPPASSGQSLHRILFATDLSPATAAAAAVAVQFAEAAGAELDVLHVVKRGADTQRLNALKDRYSRALDAVLAKKPDAFDDLKSFIEAGDAHERILEHIRDRAIDLLVLGIRKTSHLGIRTKSSGAFPLIVHARCPVLTITSGPGHSYSR
ncbi:MAG TPA: universal stress protein [Acidobacteriaceae bacterium]|nr:universal stress protein [Acidobacteriaceae bacterium]